MKTLLPLLFCCSLALCAAASAASSLSGYRSAVAVGPIAPLEGAIVLLPADTLTYTMEEARRNIKTAGLFLLVGLVSVSPPVLYLAALVGAPVLPQLLFVLGALSLVWGGLKFIQGRIRLRRLRAHRRNSPGG
jgi:uncharacterized membrane protein